MAHAGRRHRAPSPRKGKVCRAVRRAALLLRAGGNSSGADGPGRQGALRQRSMQPFAYAAPATLAEAWALLNEQGPEACLLAGGTDVVVGLRNRTLRPKVVIDLKRVSELRP